MKVLLVGNYLPDKQESMLRFSNMLQSGLTARGIEAKLVQAAPLVNRFPQLPDSLQKWPAYVDKLLLFPPQLKQLSKDYDLVHICDQGNAVYLQAIGGKPNLVTCHDLLAVQAARGEDSSCRVSATGKILQNWILQSLKSADFIACDSNYTAGVVKRLVERTDGRGITTIEVGLNYPYRPLPDIQIQEQLSLVPGLNSPYILHVGSNEARKNREAVLRIFACIKPSFAGQLVFAGQPLTTNHKRLAANLDISQQIIEVVKPSNQLLHSLYSGAFALLFPSLAEGFGWPIVEAQACGCPVIASNRGPLPEIAGNAAVICPVEDEEEFAQSLLNLKDTALRQTLIARGLQNVGRFNPDIMVNAYLKLYHQALS